MNSRKNGSSLIIGIIVLVVLGAVIFYFASDVFQTKVDRQVRQATKWTPENIQADPVGYLEYAFAQCGASKSALEAREIGLRTQLGKFQREIQAKSTDLASAGQVMDDAKNAYTNAAASGTWPVTYKNQPFDESRLKRLIVEAARKKTLLEKQVAAYGDARQKVDMKLGQVKVKLDEVNLLRTQLESGLEVARVNKTVDGIEGINDQLGSIMDTSMALAQQQDDAGLLDSVMTQTPDQAIDDEFSKIMGN